MKLIDLTQDFSLHTPAFAGYPGPAIRWIKHLAFERAQTLLQHFDLLQQLLGRRLANLGCGLCDGAVGRRSEQRQCGEQCDESSLALGRHAEPLHGSAAQIGLVAGFPPG